MNDLNDDELNIDISSDDDNNNNNLEVICDECSIIIENAAKLSKHKEYAHKDYICSECGYIVVGKKSYVESINYSSIN